MTDHDALLHAVCSEPEADAPRLVLADFLEERDGKGDALRAEFIRTQVALARCSSCNPSLSGAVNDWTCNCEELRRREQELLGGSGRGDWPGGPGAWPLAPPNPGDWRRGFVETVTCTWADWSAHAGHVPPAFEPGTILGCQPVKKVRLIDWPDYRLGLVEAGNECESRLVGREPRRVRRDRPTRKIVEELLAAEWKGIDFELPPAQSA